MHAELNHRQPDRWQLLIGFHGFAMLQSRHGDPDCQVGEYMV
jgi:hypothetical protein